jgi:TRAP-type transport system periplasmic protein
MAIRRKNMLFCFLVLMMVVSLVLSAVSISSAQAPEQTAAKPIELRWSIAWPPTDVFSTRVIPWAKNEIEKRTNGRVKFTLFYSGQILGMVEVYQGVVKRIADIGTSRMAFTPGRFPVGRGYEMPGIIFNNAQVTNSVAWELYKKYKPAEFNDTHMIWIDSTGPGMLYTKTRVTKLEDIKNMEIRADGLVLEAIKALGAVPVSMPMSEIYLALDKGIVKGTLDRLGGLKDWRHAEVTKYILMTPFIYTSAVFFNAMNLDAWNSLPPDIQKVFNEVGEEMPAKSGQFAEEHEMVGLKYGLEKRMEVNYLTPQETARWTTLIKPVQNKWVAEVEAKGFPGKQMLEDQYKLADQYNKKYPNVRGKELPK